MTARKPPTPKKTTPGPAISLLLEHKEEVSRPTKKAAGAPKSPVVEVIASKTGIITIPGVETEKLTTLIIGVSPLIVHKFAQKYRDKILEKHMGVASKGRERKVPEDNYNAARHRLTDGGDGFPAGGLKACLVSGFSRESGVAMTKAKGGIRIGADDPATNLVEIICPHEPRMREDVVRNESGVVDIRHRPEYWPWAMLLEIEYLPALMSAGQVLQALSMSGFTNGLGEWRPASKESKSGSFGAFRLATLEEVADFEADRLLTE